MFRTELSIAPATDQLARTARVLTMGSCFADSIGTHLTASKVATLVNPFGTVFQPLALGRLLRAAAGEEVDWQQHLVQARGRWQSYDVHGSIGADSPVELLQHIQELVRRTGEFLRQADVVLLTLGTAWAYRLRETGELVNNCHKQPADLFVKELLTPDEIINGLAETHAYLRRINPNLRFVLTVSPVRHLKDTLPLNSVSKSVLRVATHIVSDLLPGVAYFPAYELLVDELRDYRFYASDMLHPSEVAEDYIWDKFARTYFDVDFGRFRKEWAAVRQALGHRPLHEGAPEHREFLENTQLKLEQLSLRKVDVASELNEVRAKLSALPAPKQPEPVELVEDDEERIDIGEDSTQLDAPMPTPAPVSDEAALVGENRPARLSPEEFRSQRGARSGRPERGRRDGRGKGQSQAPAENEEFQATGAAAISLPEAGASIPSVALVPAALGEAEELLELTAMPTAASSDDALGEDEPAKKKKRRSRGGAKRTARKNALRLASGEITAAELALETMTAAEDASEEPLEDRNTGEDSRKSSVITKSQPVKRGGRANEVGRVPRVALYTPANDALAEAASVTSDEAVAPAPDAATSRIEQPMATDNAAEAGIAGSNTPRNGRNRGRKNADSAVNLEAAGGEGYTAQAETTEGPGSGNAEQASGMPEPATKAEPRRNLNTEVTQATPTADAVPAASDSDVAGSAPVAPAASRSSRPKRAVSQARAEKPAVDTPVIPVPDELRLRTQVAAGRMTGSSASLIEQLPEQATPAKKAAATKKPVAPKAAKAAKAAAPPVAPTSAAAEAKPKPAKKAAPAPKAKPEAKPKAPPAKVAATKPAAAKPKAPRKPAKPS